MRKKNLRKNRVKHPKNPKEKAALKIQKCFRAYLAREKMRNIYRSQYTKMYDLIDKNYIYVHKKSNKLFNNLPMFFKSEEIQSPRKYEAPEGYFPGDEYNYEGYILVVTSNIFSIGKWHNIEGLNNKDYDSITKYLDHDYICKFRPENTFCLKNPTTNEFKKTIKQMSKQCKSSGYLVIYMATHILTLRRAEKSNKKENCYFAFKNSVWGPNSEIAETCISLTSLTELINSIRCKRKTIVLNYGFVEKPSDTFFGRAKVLYPPEDFVLRLANQTSSVVIGSCSIGTKAKKYIDQIPEDVLYEINLDNETVKSDDSQYHYFETHNKREYDLFNKLNILMKEWKIRDFPPISRTPKPENPVAKWSKSNDSDIAINLPTEKEV